MLIANNVSESAALFQWGVILIASLVAALWDVKCCRIPNLLTLPLFAAGLLQAAVFSGWDGFISSLLAGVILAAPYVVLFLCAGGGAGDAKLMGAAGAWLGLSHVLAVLLFVSIFGIIVALLKAIYKKQFFAVLKRIHAIILSFFVFVGTRGKVNTMVGMAQKQDGEELTVPYGPAIFAGLLAAAIYSHVTQ